MATELESRDVDAAQRVLQHAKRLRFDRAATSLSTGRIVAQDTLRFLAGSAAGCLALLGVGLAIIGVVELLKLIFKIIMGAIALGIILAIVAGSAK